VTSPDSSTSPLAVLHQRLEGHFAQLRSQRGGATPVFALEHGLSEGELALLRDEVSGAARRGVPPRGMWLPFIVYAAEVGYEFCGDEYWHTFEARTPGWSDLGDPARQYMRSRYREFRIRFGGAEPSGPWARHFSIICWPITHAVLPVDLQRHLARLLFEFRRSLTAEMLTDPEDLGRRLAARAWHASTRFQTFAQNTNLLGQVAAALLVGEGEDSPYLLRSTLTRIVDDLSKEREARRWLEDAKFTARSVRTRGFRSSASSGRDRSPGARRESVASTDPDLFVRDGPDGWALYMELPDLVSLAERLPIISEELARLRPRVEGVTRRFAQGHLLHAGQQVRVSAWPRRDRPLIQLENGSSVVNALLADQCIMSTGPRWLFRARTRSFGSEVRGKFVRPGHEYVLLSESPCEDLPPWASAARSATEGVYTYALSVPSEVNDVDLAAIHQIGVGAVMDVEVRPAGFVPARWDGEGTAEWLEGEDPVIAIRSTRSVGQCIFTLDDVAVLRPWPDDANEIVVRLSDLAAGTHQLRVSLLPNATDVPVAEGGLDVVVRSPHTRPPTGTPREGLMILASPASPTLGEIWDGQAKLQVVGPVDTRALVRITLADRLARPLVTRTLTLGLPAESARWGEVFSQQFRRIEEVHRTYERAESCAITVTAQSLGTVSLRCERAFAPLRWAFGRDREGPYVYLVDNTDGVHVKVTRYDFSRPADEMPVPGEGGLQLRWPDGGLVSAAAGDIRAAVILPPLVRTFADLRAAPSRFPALSKSAADVLRLIQLADLWATAALPADPFASARRLAVLQQIAHALAGLIGGRRWAAREADCVRAETIDLQALREAIGDGAYQRRLANALRSALSALQAGDVPTRVARFAEIVGEQGRPAGVTGVDRPLAEFLLRLATDPGTLLTWPTAAVDDLLGVTLASPVLLRAARFVVLATATGDDDSGSIYTGWTWQ
jgi:hypothetical protein